MTWEIFIALAAFAGTAVGIMTPIIKLNSSITRLTCAIDELNKHMDVTDKRVDKCIDILDDHEKRINNLERR